MRKGLGPHLWGSHLGQTLWGLSPGCLHQSQVLTRLVHRASPTELLARHRPPPSLLGHAGGFLVLHIWQGMPSKEPPQLLAARHGVAPHWETGESETQTLKGNWRLCCAVSVCSFLGPGLQCRSNRVDPCGGAPGSFVLIHFICTHCFTSQW